MAAGDEVVGGAGSGGEGGDGGAAGVVGIGAALGEGAAAWEVEQRGDLSGDVGKSAGLSGQGGDGVHESTGVGVAGGAEDVADGAGLDDAGGVHDDHAVAGVPDDAHVVGDEEEGGVLSAHLAHEVENLCLDGDVEGGGGLVGDDESGVEDEGLGDHDALSHAAGELEGEGVEAGFGGGDADVAEPLEGALACVCAGGVWLMESDGLGELVSDAVEGGERGHGLLEDDADVASASLSELAVRELEEVGAVEEDLSGDDASWGLWDESRDGHGGDALAAAGFADESERLALMEGEGDAVGGGEDAVVGLELDGEVLDVEHDGRTWGRWLRDGDGIK